ncbi:bifunctional cytochrome P450/NADPH--P450 reductase [Goodfellowiella coeruleoviolacea]|uniref:Bifunctional cytochrome P450/NADPH--P450 reductase n=1 Tax=Goodfellowiella coeruleoviolacea TaxID=334858 RepID=A0AAE3GE36_9PSEU|nr:cytochrome P450 [Goodfellowiella coeruleoviolacea]MCP2165612.1 cytochrome P450 / NADPH-cytochrome P450 reductase [Goodfellowiella coeruleoviolacea]
MTETLPPLAATHGGVPVIDVSDRAPNAAPVLDTMALARAHGPVFVQRRFGQDLLVVGDLDLVTDLADEQRFCKVIGPALENVRGFAGDGLFTAYNEEPNWAKAHDILMPAFALGSMRTYHPVMVRVARRLIAAWDRHAAAGTPVDVPDDMTRMTLDTIGLAGFGFDFGSFERDEPHPFVSAMVRCLDWSMRKLFRRPDADHTEADAAFRADADYLASVVDEVIAARRSDTATGGGDTEAEDLLGLMLNAPHPVDGTTLDAANIRNQVITFLIAGHETTSGALSFALHYLTKHPTALREVRREVDQLWGEADDPEPTFEDVGRLRYTRQVLNEALRLWPTAPVFARQARQDTLLGGRVPVRAGQPISVLVPVLHRDPVWGDNPELFDPDRFAPELEAARSPHAFKPFGTGERACIGRQFALHEATMLLGLLVHRYRLLDHADYQLRLKQTLTIKPDGFTLTLRRRTSADRAVTVAARAEAAAPTATPADGLPTRVRPGTGLLVLHGSNYGTCRQFAADLVAAATDLGCAASLAPLDAHAGALPTDRPVVVVAASYNGLPTDDAAAFVRWLADAEPGAAAGVPYAVLGVGDRNWSATYQRVPTLIDERLAALGGTRLLDRAEADASGELDAAVTTFTVALRASLLERYGDPDSVGATGPDTTGGPGYTVTEVTGGPLAAAAARHELTALTVTEVDTLTHPDHPRVKRFVRLALPDGVTYRTGDHLAVLPANDPALVARAARLLRADLDTVLSIVPTRARRDALAVDRPVTVRDLLTHHVELQDRPTAAQLAVLAEANPCPPERAALRALAEDAEARAADHRSLLDLVEDHPALRETLTWPVLLDLLPPMRIRHYSISSSPEADPRHLDLMVSLLAAPARSGRGEFRGTGSGYLAALRPGDTVLARVQPCREAFRMVHDADTPVIMIAAGTGLAPFRGAIADRAARLAGGAALAPALCYFGCDAPDADYLHADELRAAESAGAVSLRPAFSAAPVAGQRFVQHRLAAEADEVWALLGAGAKVYVCGDGTRMAPGVRDAFQDVYLRHTPGADRDAAAEWLRGLFTEGRYVEDVYAG